MVLLAQDEHICIYVYPYIYIYMYRVQGVGLSISFLKGCVTLSNYSSGFRITGLQRRLLRPELLGTLNPRVQLSKASLGGMPGIMCLSSSS